MKLKMESLQAPFLASAAAELPKRVSKGVMGPHDGQ